MKSLFPPPAFERSVGTVIVFAIAGSDSIDGVWRWTDSAVGILPHHPRAPARRHDRRWAILCKPEPAILEHRINRGTQGSFDRMAAIKPRPTAEFVVYVSDKRSSFFERHAASGGIVLEVEHNDGVFVWLDGIQKMQRLGHAV